jgi:hypothetical protein
MIYWRANPRKHHIRGFEFEVRNRKGPDKNSELTLALFGEITDLHGPRKLLTWPFAAKHKVPWRSLM